MSFGDNPIYNNLLCDEMKNSFGVIRILVHLLPMPGYISALSWSYGLAEIIRKVIVGFHTLIT